MQPTLARTVRFTLLKKYSASILSTSFEDNWLDSSWSHRDLSSSVNSINWWNFSHS